MVKVKTWKLSKSMDHVKLRSGSKVIITRTPSFLENMPPVGISHPNLPLSHFRDPLGGRVTVPTHSQILGDSDRHVWWLDQHPKSYRQLFAVKAQHLFFVFLFHIMQHITDICFITRHRYFCNHLPHLLMYLP